jgi:hypothetical protein
MDYAPYVYVIPSSGPDLTCGRTASAETFAIDFLHEAYSDPQFASKQADIYNKIASLADWILTRQHTNSTPFYNSNTKHSQNQPTPLPTQQSTNKHKHI